MAEIEAEQKLVAGNRELIERFEKKIQQTLARVWGEMETVASAKVAEVAYIPGLFACYVLNALRNDPNCGRTKLEKCNHLAEYHCSVPLGRHAIRDKYGPVDYAQLKKVEQWAAETDCFATHDPGNREKVIYTPGGALPGKALQAADILGAKKAEVDRLLHLLMPLTSRECEIRATLYAAWNDFLLAGKSANERDIIHDIQHNWHVTKQSIQNKDWLIGIRWLRLNKIIPTGTGQPTNRVPIY